MRQLARRVVVGKWHLLYLVANRAAPILWQQFLRRATCVLHAAVLVCRGQRCYFVLICSSYQPPLENTTRLVIGFDLCEVHVTYLARSVLAYPKHAW
jgi:hypothetical protein